MPVQLGRDMILQVEIGGGSFETVGGLRATSMTLGNVTVPSTDIKSGGWRQILADCGNQTMSITASGIWKGTDAENLMIGFWNSRVLQFFRIYFQDGTNFYAQFQVVKLTYDGSYNGARQYTVNLESSGEVAYTGAES